MKYYLIVGEASGDLHASHLMAALKVEDPQAEFRFFGGDLMAAVGGTMVKHYKELAYMGSLPPEKWAGMSDERIGRLVRAVENAVRKAVTLKEKMNGDNTHSGG